MSLAVLHSRALAGMHAPQSPCLTIVEIDTHCMPDTVGEQ